MSNSRQGLNILRSVASRMGGALDARGNNSGTLIVRSGARVIRLEFDIAQLETDVQRLLQEDSRAPFGESIQPEELLIRMICGHIQEIVESAWGERSDVWRYRNQEFYPLRGRGSNSTR